MKKSPILLLALFVCAPQAHAMNEGNEGRGGGGYVCVTKDSRAEVRLVDLEEANLRSAFDSAYHPIPRTDVPLSQQVADAIIRLSKVDYDLAKKVEAELKYIQEHNFPIPTDWVISPPKDVNADVIPANCPLDGVATYWDVPGILWIRMSYYIALVSETDRAALFIHEAIYKVFRGAPWLDENSVRTRKIVGILFSDESDFLRDQEKLAVLIK